MDEERWLYLEMDIISSLFCVQLLIFYLSRRHCHILYHYFGLTNNGLIVSPMYIRPISQGMVKMQSVELKSLKLHLLLKIMWQIVTWFLNFLFGTSLLLWVPHENHAIILQWFCCSIHPPKCIQIVSCRATNICPQHWYMMAMPCLIYSNLVTEAPKHVHNADIW